MRVEERECLIEQFNLRFNSNIEVFPVKTANELISLVEYGGSCLISA